MLVVGIRMIKVTDKQNVNIGEAMEDKQRRRNLTDNNGETKRMKRKTERVEGATLMLVAVRAAQVFFTILFFLYFYANKTQFTF